MPSSIGAVNKPGRQSGVGWLARPRPAAGPVAAAPAPLLNPRAFLVRVLVGVLPAAALFAAGHVAAAGYCFWGVFALLAVRLAVRGGADEFLCLLVALTLPINLLRDFATYNIVVVLLFAALAWECVAAPPTVWRLWRRYWLALLLLAGASAYYAVSWALTGEYAVNLRLLELSFTVLAVVVIGRHRALLTAALAGLCLATVAIGLAFLVQTPAATAGRLGMVVVGDRVLGNPVQLGVPLALSLLVLVADRGQWSSFERAWFWRWSLVAVTLVLLALSTSRAAWSVAGLGLVVGLLFGSQQRLRIAAVLGLAALAGWLLLLSPYGTGFQHGLTRTFGEEESLAHRTSGRSDQWRVAYQAITASPGAFFHGYGPGRGADVYAEVSQEVAGVRYAVGEKVALHSLFMQVAVETGLVGVFILIGWLVMAGRRIVRWCRSHGLVFPLACFLGYVVVAGTVSGNDTASATLLAVGLLTTGWGQP